jgi:serine phosphatase RsbU (regulator of sigma subunit)
LCDVRILDESSDLLLGVDPATDRAERVVEFVDGATLLLYTDGLVERRDTAIDEGITHLQQAFVGDRDPETVCDLLLKACSTEDNEDDVALLVRANPRNPARATQPDSQPGL